MHMLHSRGNIHGCEEKAATAKPEMGYNSMLRSPKREEQQVPDTEFVDIKDVYADEDMNINEDELERIWGIEDEENYLAREVSQQLSWDFMDLEGFGNGNIGEDEEEEEEEEQEEEEEEELRRKLMLSAEESSGELNKVIIKKENESSVGFWDDVVVDDDEEKKVALNLNLNYQKVLDAWSDRGPLWADECSLSMASNGYYMGEVPVLMEEERTRREASVLRYREKRQTRLFSKKIRYQVRKLNADKRPRLKGRFVKRVS